MNWTKIKAKWRQLRGRAKMTWGRLTDDDLEMIRGKRDMLVGKLTEVYGLAREEAERQVSEFARNMGAVAGRAEHSAKRALLSAKKAGRGALGKALGTAASGLDQVRKKIAPGAGKETRRSGRHLGGRKVAVSKPGRAKKTRRPYRTARTPSSEA